MVDPVTARATSIQSKRSRAVAEAEGHEQLGSCSQHEMHCCSLCQYVSHLLCGSVAVVPSLEARQSQHHFEVARITARAAACPTGTSSMEKKKLRRTLSHLISHKLKCARGMDVLGGWGDHDRQGLGHLLGFPYITQPVVLVLRQSNSCLTSLFDASTSHLHID
jgi:hypothetical protein